MANKKKDNFDYLELKVDFNDRVMRELGLDLTDEGYLFDIDTESVIQIKSKYIKYSEYEYPVTGPNEIDFNVIDNSRLMETISFPFLVNYCNSKGYEFHSISQNPAPDSNKGTFVLTYKTPSGEVKEIKSDLFKNESVRVFNLICKINKTTRLYDFEEMDIIIPRKR